MEKAGGLDTKQLKPTASLPLKIGGWAQKKIYIVFQLQTSIFLVRAVSFREGVVYYIIESNMCSLYISK